MDDYWPTQQIPLVSAGQTLLLVGKVPR